MLDRSASHEEFARLEGQLDQWLTDLAAQNDAIEAVERGETDEHRWYVRMLGEARDRFTVWLTLRQRSLHHESYVMPAPRWNAGELYEHLLRRNAELRGVHFAIGDEDAIFLVGRVPLDVLDPAAVDAVLGLHFEAIERYFPGAMRIGFTPTDETTRD